MGRQLEASRLNVFFGEANISQLFIISILIYLKVLREVFYFPLWPGLGKDTVILLF